MKVAALAVIQRADVTICRQHRADLIARHVTHTSILVLTAQLFELGPEVRVVTLFDGRQHLAVGPVAINPVLRDQFANQRQRLDRHVPQDARGVGTDQPFDLGLRRSETIDRLAAAAARRTPPNTMLLEEHDAIAAFCQVQRRRAPGDAPTHHAYIAVHGSGQCRAFGRRVR